MAPLIDKGFRVQYDSYIGDEFLVTDPGGGEAIFARTPEGLYAFEPTAEFLNEVAKAKGIKPRTVMKRHQSHVIDTVKGNMEGFTERQVRYAKLARKAAAILTYPTEENLKYALRQKLFKNCPLTVEDVNNAEKIFGKDVAAMKGKMTRKKPNPIRLEVVEFPPEIIDQIRDLILSLDIMYVNTLPIMTSIDRTIRYRSAVPMESRAKEELFESLDQILRNYNGAGFEIGTISSDHEFVTLLEDLKDELGITLNSCPAGEHEPNEIIGSLASESGQFTIAYPSRKSPKLC